MKINWKVVSASPGYKSLKAAYINDVMKASKQKHPMRNKAEFLDLFNWVICRATHYAAITGEPLEDFLNKWETDRGRTGWLNGYGRHRQGKLRKVGVLSPETVKRTVKTLRFNYRHNPVAGNEAVVRYKTNIARARRIKLGKKARWDTPRKKRAAHLRELLAAK